MLCTVAPAIAEEPSGRQVIADAVTAANWQLRLDLAREQRHSLQITPEQYKRQEDETKDVIDRLRGKWSWTLYRFSFESDFSRALKDPVYRARALADYDSSPGWFNFSGDLSVWDIISYVIVGLVVLFVIGAIMAAFNKAADRSKVEPEAQTSDTYGSADFAEARAFITDGMYVFSGVFFGKSSLPAPAHLHALATHPGAPVCSTPENHTLIVARTRTGKGTRVIIPTLLRYVAGSALVIDPKGENAAITARARASMFKNKVHIVNPWGVLDATFQKLGLQAATYNPLDILDRTDPNVVATAQAMAAAICPEQKGGKDAYWSNAAASVLTAVLLWLTDQPGEQKTLGRAREIVSLSRANFKQYLSKMAASEAFDGAIREHAAPFVDLAGETYSGVMSNLGQHTKFLSDPRIKKATATSSFSMMDLLKSATTLYLVIPPDLIKTQRTWLRLLITAGMQTYKHHTLSSMNRCMFMIDEFAALGHLDELPRDIATMAGYGVDFTLIVQGIDQLKDEYGDAHGTILSNCAFKWFCNVNDLHSAEYLSRTLGKKTVATGSSSTSLSQSPGGGSTSASTTRGETGRPLLMPDEILNLGRDTAILLAPGEKPNYLRTVDYWDLPGAFEQLKAIYPNLYWNEFALKYDPNPYHK